MSAQPTPNLYSQRWFESFHLTIPEARTNLEVEFICAFAPQPHFFRIADVCCGAGRHTRALAERGYLVTGIDRDPAIVAKATELGGGPSYLREDLRHYVPGSGEYDLMIIMGQSFGHFDTDTNTEILRQMAAGLRDRGRILLDLWNPPFFMSHQGQREFSMPGGVVQEMKRVEAGRLFVHLEYPHGDAEDFEWELFTAEDIGTLAAPLGLRLMACCTDFDRSAAPSDAKARIQFVLERV